MSFAAFVTRRFAFAVFAALLVVTLTFGVVALTPNPQLQGELAMMERSGASDAEIEQFKSEFRKEHGMTGSLVERYGKWVVGIATLDWGETASLGNRPVTDVVANRLPYTLAYVVPSFLLTLSLGVLGGLFDALNRNSATDRGSRLVAYAAMGIPSFWLVNFLDQWYNYPWLVPRAVVPQASATIGSTWQFSHPLRYALPTFVLSLGLLAGLLQHARAESLEHVNADFVKLLYAKGSGRLQTARHVLRNAAIPILSMSLSEVIAVLMLNVYVIETVFGIPGVGALSLYAVENRDMALILGTTMVLVFVGIVGNFFQDVLHGYLDPRIEQGGESA
ncbi:ABC transporter permease [Halobacterium zhouii]|uniref:ABC transporter permease n=1 Tax=Halobacterium zhouii TaxID=2902624 RepID=UPI001E2D9F5B|nr:ABC transporter permease [Halobacterium zhouii]